jgi:hypothetical protein
MEIRLNQKMNELRIEIEKAYRVWNEFFTETTADGWIDIFANRNEQEALKIWSELSTSRIPNPLEVRAAIAGIAPHKDWQNIVAVANGRMPVAEISIAAAAALSQVGGLSSLRSADNRQLEKLRSTFWQLLDFGLGSELVEIALSEYLGGVASNPGLPALPASVAPEQMTFLEAVEAIKGWEDRVYPTAIGRDAQKAVAMAKTLAAGKIRRSLAIEHTKSWSVEAKSWVLEG